MLGPLAPKARRRSLWNRAIMRNAVEGEFRGRPEIKRRVHLETLRQFETAAPDRLPVSARVSPADRVVSSRGRMSSGGVLWLTGPAYVESLEQVLFSAELANSLGLRFLRSRAQWPNARPEDSRRHLRSGLKLLASAARHFNLQIVAEVVAPGDIDLLLQYADILEVPAERCGDLTLLQELQHQGASILLHRSPLVGINSFLRYVEVVERGASTVLLADNGIHSWDAGRRASLDVAALAQLRRERPYPLLVNCTALAHDAQDAESVALAAIAAGADGILAEICPCTLKAVPGGVSAASLEGIVLRARALKSTLNAIEHHRLQTIHGGIR
ncbi:MAG: hypothetical protein KDD69_02805 [Bdellovibrionales bacterium]|nr:hypothetical protein [Bdellovibrionales bacterium]